MDRLTFLEVISVLSLAVATLSAPRVYLGVKKERCRNDG